MNIRVSYIGDVSGHVDYDYQAVDDDDGRDGEIMRRVGFGRTEIAAVRELLDIIEEASDGSN
jgi:hypothetical protein